MFIYGLYDPSELPPQIRYVGFTSKPLHVRLGEHVTEAKASARTHKHQWIRSVLAKGVQPSITPLEEVTAENWQARESFWIRELAALRLTNSTAGGEGLINPSADVIEAIRAKVSQALRGNKYRAGKPHPEADKAKISAGLLASEKKKAADAARRGKPGHKLSDEAKRKISEAKKGRPNLGAKANAKALNEARVGAKWITNGVISKQLRVGELMPDGWRIGRTKFSAEHKQKISEQIKKAAEKIFTAERNQKIAEARRSKRWITDGVSTKQLPKGQPLPDGWKYGFTRKK